MRKLSAKQARFCQEYLVDLNATQAAIRSGYSERAAKTTGPRLLENAGVKAEIDRLNAIRAEKAAVTPEWVLAEFLRLADVNVAEILGENHELKPVSEWPENIQRAVSGIDVEEVKEWDDEEKRMRHVGYAKKVRFHSKVAALTALAKHLKLLTDRIEVEGTGKLADALAEAIKRVETGKK